MRTNAKALVTGADGFIGSHLVETYQKGENVRAFCLYNSTGSWGWLDTLDENIKNEIEVILGDVRDYYAYIERKILIPSITGMLIAILIATMHRQAT